MFATSPRTLTDRRIRTAVIGTGGIARGAHLPALQALGDDIETVAAFDIDEEAVRAFCADGGIPHPCTDLGRMLDEHRPDLVTVCTPPVFHREQTVAALRSGAWVWCEKPPCPSLADFDAIEAAEGADGGPYASIVFQHRFGSGALHARSLIADRAMGRPLVAHCQTTWYRDAAYYAVPWRGTWANEGGGPAMGHGIHQMDLLLDLLGPWSEVRAMAGRMVHDVETEDVSTALVRFESGALATIVNSVLSPDEVSRVRVDCERVTVEVTHLYGHTNDDWRITPAPGVDPAELAGWRDMGENVPSSHLAQLRALVADLRAGRRPRGSGADGRTSLELITALYKSAFTDTTVRAGEIGPGDPFHAALHGNIPGWAPAARPRHGDPRMTAPEPTAPEPITLVPTAPVPTMADPAVPDPAVPPGLRLTHAHGDRIDLRSGEVTLLSYVYRPEAAWEAPKPYLHPLRTLSGGVVTDYRPNDHRWHKGLQLTASHLSGQNLWGGNSYVRGEGYLPLPERVGSMSHEGFDEVSAAEGRAVIAERLAWRNHDGDPWADESRRIEIHDLDPAAGAWTLTWSSAVTNRRDEPLRFGSPTTEGREMAGYTGLFWRGPRAFRAGRLLGPELEGEELMGTQAPWVAYSGEFDSVDGHATVVFAHAPENDHTGAGGEHPAHWFVRSDPFAAVAPSWAFHEELVLRPGDTLTRRWRVVMADGRWERDDIAAYLKGLAW